MEYLLQPLIVFGGTLAVTIAVGTGFDRLLRYSAIRRPRHRLPALLRRAQLPLQFLLGCGALHFTYSMAELHLRQDTVIENILATLAIVAAVWLAMRVVDAIAESTLRAYAGHTSDIRRVRHLNTQLIVIRRVASTLLAMASAAVAMLVLFPQLRTLGTSLLASAGVIGIIAGVAAQSTLGNLLAGLQIAFGDSVKIGDTVVVEKQTGTVEEISLLFLTIKTWDERRITMPVSYFNSKPYENWSKGGQQLTGSVFLSVDFDAPLGAMRKHLQEFLRRQATWDGRGWGLVVTDSNSIGMQVRASMTAANSSDLFALRCAVREELIDWLVHHHPTSLPRVSTIEPQLTAA